MLPKPLSWIVLVTLLFALLFARGVTRRFDLDEHQFVAPAVFLANEGLWPYRDYPYFHMPNLVLLYTAVMAWAPDKLLTARVVSVACGTGIVGLVFATGWRRLAHAPNHVRWWLAGGLTATFLCSRMFLYTQGWAWNHEAATLSALAAVLFYRRALSGRALAPGSSSGAVRESRPLGGCAPTNNRGLAPPHSFLLLLCAGFFATNAACIRLSYAPIVMPLAGMLLFGPSRWSQRERCVGLLFASLGGIVAAIPSLVCLTLYREQFLFGNLTYASLSTSAYAAAGAPGMTPLDKFLYFFRCFLSDPGNFVLLVATLAALRRIHTHRLWRGPEGHGILLGLLLLPVLWVGATGPTPVQYQYWYMLVPFALVLVFDVLGTLRFQGWPGLERSETPDERGLVLHVERRSPGLRYAPAPATLFATFRWAVVIAVAFGFPRGYWRIVDLPFPERWPPVAVHRTGEWIAERVPRGGMVLTLDPLFALEADLEVHPHFAVGRFPMIVGPFTSSEQRQRQKFLWGRELNAFLCRERPEAVLCDRRTLDLVPWFVDYAEDLDFCRHESPDGEFVLWTRTRAHRAQASGGREPTVSLHVRTR